MFMEYQFSLWIQRTVLKNTFSKANAWIALVIILVDVDTSSSNSISLQWRHNERDDVPNHRRFYATVCSGEGERKRQSSALLAFVRGIYRWPVNSPPKGPETRKMIPFEDVIIWWAVLIKLWLISLYSFVEPKSNRQ